MLLRSRSSLPVLSAVATLVLSTAPRPAVAQDALALFAQGRTLVEKGDYAAACPLFAEAHRLQPAAIGIVINLGDCYGKTGKTASAWSAYREGEFLAKKSGENERAQYAHDHAAALEPMLSRLKVMADPTTPGLIVHRDDQEVGRGILGTSFPVDPGTHKIEATAPGYLVWSATINIGTEHDEQVVTIPALGKAAAAIAPTPGPAPAGEPVAPSFWTGMRVGGVVAMSVGAVGIAVGSVFGATAISKKNQSGGDCGSSVGSSDPNACTSAGAQLRSDGLSAAGVATGVFVAGAVVLAGGITLMAVGGKKTPAARVGVGPGSVVLSGKW